MNFYIIIIVIVLIILFISDKKKENYSSESIDTLLSVCKDNGLVNTRTVSFNNLNINGTLQIGTKKIKSMPEYLLDILFPYGSFYVQYPDINSNIEFPLDTAPGVLFGGDWQEQWNEESVFFRTRGPEAREYRSNGFQNDAIRLFTGKTSFTQTEYDNPGVGASGVFAGQVNLTNIGTDHGDGHDWGHITIFDSARQAYTSNLETRPRNRRIKIWKRVKKISSTVMPPPPENGFDAKYDNVYFTGPYPNTTFSYTKFFLDADRVGTKGRALQKCKELGDACTYVGYMEPGGNNEPYRYTYTSDNSNVYDYDKDNKSFRTWKKEKEII